MTYLLARFILFFYEFVDILESFAFYEFAQRFFPASEGLFELAEGHEDVPCLHLIFDESNYKRERIYKVD